MKFTEEHEWLRQEGDEVVVFVDGAGCARAVLQQEADDVGWGRGPAGELKKANGTFFILGDGLKFIT